MPIDKPLLRYPGSKFKIRKWITGFFPEHKVYTEAFLGSGSILFHKKPSKTEVVNDVDSNIVNLFNILRNPVSTHRLSELLFFTPYAREEYENSFIEGQFGDLEKARRFIFQLYSGQMGKVCKSGFDTRIKSGSRIRDGNEKISKHLRMVGILGWNQYG